MTAIIFLQRRREKEGHSCNTSCDFQSSFFPVLKKTQLKEAACTTRYHQRKRYTNYPVLVNTSGTEQSPMAIKRTFHIMVLPVLHLFTLRGRSEPVSPWIFLRGDCGKDAWKSKLFWISGTWTTLKPQFHYHIFLI